jgi:adenine-specific DNA-methyltransferase
MFLGHARTPFLNRIVVLLHCPRFGGHYTRGPYKLQKLERTLEGARPTMTFEIQTPAGPVVKTWAVSPTKYDELLADGRIAFSRSGSPYYKQFLSEYQGRLPDTWWDETGGYNQQASRELKYLFGEKNILNNPKPVALLSAILQIGSDPESLILDFFAGSGTTGHAVLDLNRQDGGNRKFILVQLPEPTEHEDYLTIADITKERVRRVIKKMQDEDAGKLDLDGASQQDLGFRVYKLAESNFKPWNAEVSHDAQALAQQLELHIDHIRDGRTADDLLYEILLKSGFPLITPVDTQTIEAKTVYSVAHGALFICLEHDLTMELIRAMAEQKPERVVCLDVGFAGNDQLKANAVQMFKTKGITSFKTV